MALVKGIDVQKSRFAALYIGQDSDSDEETGWDVLTPKTSKHRGAASKKGGTNGGQEDVKGLSKNAKKRARKRRNKSTSSDQGVSFGRIGPMHKRGILGNHNVMVYYIAYTIYDIAMARLGFVLGAILPLCEPGTAYPYSIPSWYSTN